MKQDEGQGGGAERWSQPQYNSTLGVLVQSSSISMSEQLGKALRFRALHEGPGVFIIPNPWDVASAQLLTGRAGETPGVLASLEEAVREIAIGTRGRLGLGCFPTAGEVLVPTALARFGRTFRNVEVRFDDGEPDLLLPRLIDGDLDLVVVSRYDLVRRSGPPGCAALR